MQSSKEATTSLLDLVDGKRQEHQQRQNRRQMLYAVPVIMLEMVLLIFKRVESFVLDLPPRSTTTHHGVDRAGVERDVRNPSPTSYFPFLVLLFVEQVVDTNIYSALAQAEIVRPGKVMFDPLRISYS